MLDASRAGLDHSLSEVADFSLDPSPWQGGLDDVDPRTHVATTRSVGMKAPPQRLKA